MIAPLVLGFSTVGLSFFYFAWRYNVFFVTDTQIDTRGLIYPRAIKQLFVGLYIAELCMIGLFGASVAIGPLVLMVIFLVFTILFHITLNSALDPLLYNLPHSLLAEEAALRNDVEAADGECKTASSVAGAPKKSNIFMRFLKPWVFADYYTLRQLVPQGQILDAAQLYPGDVARNAYYPPSVTSEAPLLWIPADKAGVSKQEVLHSSKVIPITDEGSELDDKNNIVWDRETTRPPVWEEKVLY